MTISQAYIEQNRVLHESNEDYGVTGSQWGGYVADLIHGEGYKSVLDYGCGKGCMAFVLGKMGCGEIAEYDPAIPGKDDPPEPAELVVLTDVLEHVEPRHLDGALKELARLTQKKLFFDVCTVKALKTLPDGRNAHLIVQPPDWWRYKLTRHFDIVHWVERSDLNMFYGEAVPKGHGAAALAAKKLRPKRRKMSPELSSMCHRIMWFSEKAHDELSRIRTIRMFEGDGDEVADMQVVWDKLDDIDDPKPMLEAVARLASKAVLMRVALTPDRNPDYWRPLIEARWHIIDWCAGEDGLGIVGAPKVAVGGVKVVGVVSPQDRFAQIVSSMARIRQRIEVGPAHSRRAILAGYGPSLADNIGRLKDEAQEPVTDVISVSGAHDFLLDHGVVPAFHVECDPRPHKADNIRQGHVGVRYLIGSVAHPVLFDKLADFDVALWHVSDNEHIQRLLRMGERGAHMITGGGSVGLRGVSLLYSMGYRDFSIYGMDCSFADNGEKQWAGAHAGKRHDVLQAVCGGRTFYTSPVLLTYATDFIEMVQKIPGQFRVYGDGLLQAMCVLHAQMASAKAA